MIWLYYFACFVLGYCAPDVINTVKTRLLVRKQAKLESQKKILDEEK